MENININKITPLIKPIDLINELPINNEIKQNILNTRNSIIDIINGKDKRLIIIVGPCSIHDPKSAIEYAKKLVKVKNKLSDKLLIIMRTYLEKPRTNIGWKGLINDPFIDKSYNINIGLHMARKLLLDINNLGLSIGLEFLDTISPQYLSDLVSWGSIGARTSESQLHRELASGLSMPIGFKNNTGGNINIAINAIKTASNNHNFLGLNKEGDVSIVITKGNKNCHIIHRGGGKDKKNYQQYFLEASSLLLKINNLPQKVMIDCSHSNSNYNYIKQIKVIKNMCDILSSGYENILGIMIESNLYEGNQSITTDGMGKNNNNLKYGISITDSCIGWKDTKQLLYKLYDSINIK